MFKNLFRVGVVGALLLVGATPARAQAGSGCNVLYNGVEASRIDSLNSPLELDTQDTLIFAGTDDFGTTQARVEMMIGPVVVESNTSTYATPESDFLATISLDDVSPYGVGLFSVTGTSDGCSSSVWVRVSGRFPLATLTGLTALGLTLGGITGQLGAVASRRRWARSAAAIGGVATGAGITILGQEFGRLQVSYPSLLGVIVAAGGAGLLLSSLFNPSLRRARSERRADRIRRRPQSEAINRVSAQDSEPTPVSETLTAVVHEPRAAVTIANPPVTTPVAAEAPVYRQPETPPAPASSPFWCYVMAPTDVFDMTDHTRTTAVLEPGNWYLVKRTVNGWAHVVANDATEGWVAEGAIHRQG